MPERFTVRGIITDARQRPVGGVSVRAFDKDLPSLRRDEFLGSAITGRDGTYEIAFEEERFRAREHGRADIYIEVLGSDNRVLGRSSPRFNPTREEHINLTIEDGLQRRLSEYERLLALLTPLIEPLSLAELNGEDVTFLVRDTDTDRRRVSWLAASGALARQTGVPAEAFYGWARREPPVPREWRSVPDMGDDSALRELLRTIFTRLVATSRDELIRALLASIEENVIPAGIRDQIDEIIGTLSRSLLVAHEAVGRLRDEQTSAPLAGITVRILDLESAVGPEEIGRETTSEEGLFAIRFAADPTDRNPAARLLRLALLDAVGAEMSSTDVRVIADAADVLEIRVPPRRPAAPDAHVLDRLIEATDIQASPELLRFLSSRNIRTLGDLRRVGGLSQLRGLPVAADDPAVRALEAHADLSRVSSDVATNATLIEAGFRSVAEIAATPLPTFVTAMHGTMGDFQAAKTQVVARAQTNFLKHALTGFAVEQSNGYTFLDEEVGDAAAVKDALPERCGCDDCEAAVSPAAFLTDLLGYTAAHVKENGNAANVTYLENTFHQPFGGLPTDCEAVKEMIRQVRLCIEALRAYVTSHPLAAADATQLEAATREYLFSAYALLLVKFGTSYEEVRLARSATPQERQALAERLGIDLTEPRPDPLTTAGDELDQLFLDPDAAQNAPRALTERAIERVFGLVDTTRDPLSDGVKIGDNQSNPELPRWRFAGAIWSQNTDDDGIVHLRVKNVVATALESHVEVYRDSALTELVATGLATVPAGNRMVKLAAKNGSGLSGSVTVAGSSANNTGISVALVPKLLVWRLRHLRTIWRQQDFPLDVLSKDYLPAADRRPIVDSDVIGADDFRRPNPAEPLFALWKKRRLWIDQRLQDLAALTKTVAVGAQTLTVPDLDKVIARLFAPVGYDATSLTPWLAATPASQFDAVAETFERGTTVDIAAARERVARDLNLTVDAFVQIARIREKHRQWERDPRSEKAQDDEFSDMFSILVRAQKQRFYPAWILEEQAASAHLGPEDFWQSQRPPRDGEWPPIGVPGRPFIDPDFVKLTDLPEPTIGKATIQLWEARHAALVAATTAIKAERETNGFDAMLRRALGHPNIGNPLQHDLVALRSDLTSSNAATVASATEKIVRDLHLTIESVNRLMTMKEQAAPASPRPPTAVHWAELYALLTAAHKVKHLYPLWVGEENTAGLSAAYWRAVKARLPRARVTVEERQEWEQALRVRSRPPVIDPDLIDSTRFNGLAAKPAFTIWQARRDWVSDTIADMAGEPTTLAGLDTIVEDTIGVSLGDLLDLDARRKEGEAIQPRLDQLSLTNAAFVYVLRIRELLAAAQPVMDAEWDSVYSILVQVSKRRRFAQWREEERIAGITLSPDFFVPPDALPVQPIPPEIRWRVSQDDRFDWLDTLQSRVDQERSLLASLHEVVSGVEEAALPRLRDSFVTAAGVGADLPAKAAWVTDRLLIDAKAGGCQRTTRIAQAIETVQALLFSIRTSQSAALQALNLTLNAPDFDEEMRWIGSYVTWRAAMFVCMYPENIAVGNLRRRQTPAFRALVKALRSSRRLTGEQACSLAAEYAAYYEDVAKLAIGATAQASVTRRSGSKCVPGLISKKPLVFMFGRGGVSNRLYWSTFDPSDTSGYAQSFWDYVPGAPVTSAVAGAAVYERSTTDRRVFLFIRPAESKLQFLAFDLESGHWNGPFDLALPPGDVRWLDIVVDQNNLLTYPPRLAIRYGAEFYVRMLSVDGTGWQEGEWKNFLQDNNAVNLIGIQQLYAMVGGMLLVREGGELEWRFIMTGGTPTQLFSSGAPLLANAEYLGAVLWGKSKIGWHRWSVQKRTDGIVVEGSADQGAHPPISDQFPLQGLKFIAPNSGYVNQASYAYERRNVGILVGKRKGTIDREQDGVYLRLVELEATFTHAPIAPGQSARYRIAPRVIPSAVGQFLIPARLEGVAADVRRNTVKLVMTASSDSATNRTYAEEAYFFVPMLLCDGLRRSREFVAALDFARTVCDYAAPDGKRKIYYGLVQEETLPAVYKRAADWLLDPLDPHAVAATRRLTYTRFTLIQIVQLLLDFADDEFTRDTAETVPRARTLYLTALAVLNLPELRQQLGHCPDVIGEIEIPLGPDVPVSAAVTVASITAELKRFKNYSALTTLVASVKAALTSDASWDERAARARELVEEAAAAEPPSAIIARALEIDTAARTHAYTRALTSHAVNQAAEQAGQLAGARLLTSVASAARVAPAALETGTMQLPWLRKPAATTVIKDVDFVFGPDLRPIAPAESPSLVGLVDPDLEFEVIGEGIFVPHPPPSGPQPIPPPSPVTLTPGLSLAFCVPPNPLLAALRLQAELNLHKIRTCRNIAGMKRELEPYVGPIDTVTGLPTIGASGQLVLPGMAVLRPTLYRFALLMLRAKELAAIAQHIESAMLSAIEKGVAEAYTMLRARQDLELAQSGVQLEMLRLKQANDGVTLASLQQARAQIHLDHYAKLLAEGEIEQEREALESLRAAAIYQTSAAATSFVASALHYGAVVLDTSAASKLSHMASSVSALGAGFSNLASENLTQAQIQLTRANFERRRQDWELSASLAEQDVAIGAQQVTIAIDTVDIVKQEKAIAEIRNTHAKDTVAFLSNKFTNVELYEWMSDVLEGVYCFFLQQATAVAKLAESQLAFERQEPPAAVIQSDYWQPPDDGMPADNVQGAPIDRRGLTGSARLLQDLYRLEQYAFDTNKRKLHLSKTISLALTAPSEFQRFRETGVMRFATPMNMFDRDFPGHYLRLIRSVRMSVIALVPPTEGIHATLATGGVSRVVIGPDVFQMMPIRRDPEQVALTSPLNATGVFELEAQTSGMLLPFEGSGVDATWELRMPKAANFFNYLTMADVLMTVEYTALPSWDYAQQVIQTLRQSASGERPFSFRHQLADQWYDLHNPEQTSSPLVVKFRTLPQDFPPNVNGLKIQHVVLHFARRTGTAFEIPVHRLRFTEDGSPGATGGAATSIDGIISTRRGNAGSWMSFIGKRPFGEWELALPNTEEVRGRFKSGEIEDLLFVVTYSGRTHEWPA
jgi:hypothetical protein